jgi:hypothetical protein
MLDPLCVSLGGWDGVCSPTEVPGKNVGVTEKEEGGTPFILSSSSGTAPRAAKQPQSLCAAEGAEFCFSVGL